MAGNRAPTGGSSAEAPRFRRRHCFGLGVVVGLAVAAIVGIALVAPIALAHHDAGSLETAYGNTVVSTLARLNAGGVGANPTTANAQSLQQGRQSYTGSCSQCHGTAGHTQGAFGQTSFPPATDLSGQSATSLSDGQMFYIIKNGLGFTPMPASSLRLFRTSSFPTSGRTSRRSRPMESSAVRASNRPEAAARRQPAEHRPAVVRRAVAAGAAPAQLPRHQRQRGHSALLRPAR